MSGIREIVVTKPYYSFMCPACDSTKTPCYKGSTADQMMFFNCANCGGDLILDLKKQGIAETRGVVLFVDDILTIEKEIRAAEEKAWAQMRAVKETLEKVDDLKKSLSCSHTFSNTGLGSRTYRCTKCGWIDKDER